MLRRSANGCAVCRAFNSSLEMIASGTPGMIIAGAKGVRISASRSASARPDGESAQSRAGTARPFAGAAWRMRNSRRISGHPSGKALAHDILTNRRRTMVVIRPLSSIDVSLLERLIIGYTSTEVYQATKAETPDAISFELRLTALEQPFVKRYPPLDSTEMQR